MEGIQSSTPPPSGNFFTPLLLSMAGIIATSILIICYHLIFIRYCQRRYRRHRHGISASTTRPPSSPDHDHDYYHFGNNGVEKNVLEAIPILSYYSTRNDLFRVDQTECVVCLGELEDGDSVRLLPSCRHAFHVSCIDEWFLGHASCPICRSPVVAPIIGTTSNCEGDRTVEIVTHQASERGVADTCGDVNGSSSMVQSNGGVFLRHCVSLVLPVEDKPMRLVTGLKRSVSMDQSFHVLVNIQKEDQITLPSSSSSSSSYSSSSVFKTTQSVSQLNRVSSMLVQSFSRLQLIRSNTTVGILPH